MNCARNYEKLSNFVKVMPRILVVPFFLDTVYIARHDASATMLATDEEAVACQHPDKHFSSFHLLQPDADHDRAERERDV